MCILIAIYHVHGTKRVSRCRQDIKIETRQKGVKLKDGTMDMWYSANIYKIMFLVLLIVLSLHSHGWLDDNKLEENSCHIILRDWHCTCLGLRKTTKNLLRTGGILVEVRNGHLLNMSQILLLEPTCSIIEMILLKNNYQQTIWGDACACTHPHTHAYMPTLDRNERQQTQEMCYESIAKTGKDLLNYE
jgi:hypothetical protein